MRLLSRLFTLTCALALAACGGGGGSAGTSPFPTDPGTPGTSVSDIVLVLDADTIVNSSASSVVVTATAVDANRSAVSGATITLSADNDAVLTVTSSSTTTGSDGKVTASVGIGSNRSTRVITVTAKSGSVTKTAQLSVVASPQTAVPATIELIASDTKVGTGGDQIVLTAAVKDASNNTLPSTAISWSTTTGTLSSVTTTTTVAGQATANFSAGNDRSNRSATITVTSGTVSSQITIPISGTKLTASGPSSLILGDTGQFSVQVADNHGNALAGIAVSATSLLGNALAAVGGGTTDANGLVKFNYTANFGGADTITFSGANAPTTATVTISAVDFAFDSPTPGTKVDVGAAQTVTVHLNQNGSPVANGTVIAFTATSGTLSASSATTTNGVASVSITGSSAGQTTVQATAPNGAATATLALQFVAKTPAKLVLQASPAALAPNSIGSTSSQSKIVAKVTDAVGNPVQGVTVNFSRDADPSGGNLDAASDDTDASGQATVNYIAGPESTANNGVVLRGTVASNSTITGTASVTVNQTALFITLGTGNTIGNADPQTYKKDWVVYVTDANGVAVAGVTLTMKVLPLHYLRGNLTLVADTWVYSSPVRVCRNEDANSNGVLDAGEDYNNDGVLWPGNVVAVSPGTVITDATGRATVSLLYAESYAPWVNVRLTASATVSGTESRRDAEFILVGSTPDFSKDGGPPAGQISPFGLYATVITGDSPPKCADYPTLP